VAGRGPRPTYAILPGRPTIRIVTTATDLIRLNLGCGHDVRPGWVNVDMEPSHPDVVKAELPVLPFEPNCAREVVLSHVLEHFGYLDGFVMAKEIYRVLSPGGVVHIEVPDIAWCMAQFLGAPEANTYTNPSGDYATNHRWGLYAQAIWGDQHHKGLYHKWGYTAHRLLHLLNAVGFKDIAVDYTFSHNVQCLSAKATK